MNKKSEIRITNFIYALTVILAVMAMFSLLTIDITSNYGSDNIQHFDEYNQLYLDYNGSLYEITKSQDFQDENNQSSNFFVNIYQNVNNFIENSFIARAYNTVKLIPKSISYTAKTIGISLKQIPNLPVQMFILVVALASLGVVFVFVRALWEKKI